MVRGSPHLAFKHLARLGDHEGMKITVVQVITLMVFLAGVTWIAKANQVKGSNVDHSQTTPSDTFLLGPPKDVQPVVVQARLDILEINDINDEAETFEFTGVMTLTWHDQRQAFDPAVDGVDEKVYQGAYQFNEISPSWYPQVVLVNESGLYEKSGLVLRIQPDGTSTLIEKLNAVVEVELNMRRFPFDSHRLDAVFEVLGFDHNEIVLQVGPSVADPLGSDMSVPQWIITGISQSIRDRAAPYAGSNGVTSALVVSVQVQRESFFAIRLVVIPLIVIVLLSFSVFWMDRSSLGDRISVSFIGILTGVAYQIVISDNLPHISYLTLINGFLNLSFFTMCATIVINLVVGAMDKQGKHEVGNSIDRRCRWIFPLVYFGLNLIMLGVAFLYF